MTIANARFRVGQLIQHKLFDYRGVVIDVDPHFKGSSGWYQAMARSKPPKDRPWYHVLVHGGANDTSYQTYVAERNLEADPTGAPIDHPDLADHFDGFTDAGYVTRQKFN